MWFSKLKNIIDKIENKKIIDKIENSIKNNIIKS